MSSKEVSADLQKLTNEQIVQKLRDEFDYTPGPIMPTTRKAYLMKLQRFVDERKRSGARQSLPDTKTIPVVSGAKSGSSNRTSSVGRRRETLSQAKPDTESSRRSSLGRPSAVVSSRSGDILPNVTDAELIRRLAEYNFKCGPLNDMTRTVYLKRLKGFMESGEPAIDKPSPERIKRKTVVPNDFVKPISRDDDFESPHSPRKSCSTVPV
jgi:hypothetical protein